MGSNVRPDLNDYVPFFKNLSALIDKFRLPLSVNRQAFADVGIIGRVEELAVSSLNA
jgi:hypothetical protein